jgi:hypothetical protein
MRFLLHVHVSMDIIGLWFSIEVMLFRKFASVNQHPHWYLHLLE